MDIEHLKYPIGRFEVPKKITQGALEEAIAYLENYPELVSEVSDSLNQEQLNTPYRPGGWTIRQLIHHIADSHMNALIRIKLALTEEDPVIKPYLEQKWADLADSSLPIETALELIKGIHLKMSKVLKSLELEEFDRCYFHPESSSLVSLKEVVLMYQWHAKHHLSHIHLIGL